ncbi:uncharacterized calcium-binding protein At1g02270 [Nymphaea colorata]|nr:uncharacterized calcium-binding protein At1g02270 [Nymphaea colorata]
MVVGSSLVATLSSTCDNLLKGRNRHPSICDSSEPSVSCTTFNILAPIYKRLGSETCRESEFRDYWFTRNQSILDRLIFERSSIICLQEFWVGNEELVGMYEKRLGEAGYISYKLARTNNRGDGLLTAIHKDAFTVVNDRELLFNDCGDRVAQLLHVRSVIPFWQNQNDDIQQEILIVNTHLLFPHNSSLSIVRLHQVYKILQYVEAYQEMYMLDPVPVILCGDWNGSKRGHVYKFLRSQGFISSYDTAHHYTDSDADAHKWVSHRNHRGNICGVDFIWLLNPDKCRMPLKTSWNESVFGIIKNHLRHMSMTENDAFDFLRARSYNSDYITYPGFCEGLQQLGLTKGLANEELEDLWAQADADGNGLLDYEEFQRIWHPLPSEQQEDNMDRCKRPGSMEEPVVGCFDVKNAVLFPPEVEKGMWPENYSLSDHAHLTVVFSPARMPCSQPIC